MNDAVRQALEGLGGLQAIELSHPLEERMPSFPNHPLFFKMRWQPLGEPAVVHQLIMCDHTGTHVDAPSHFPAGPQDAERSIDRWDPLHLVGHAVCVRVGPFEPVNAVIAVDAITAWERTHLPIAEGDIVLFDYRWAGGWATGAAAADFARDWPGLGRSAVDYLVERGVRAVGTDCLSIDAADGAGGEFPAHTTFLPAGIAVFENLANLSQVPAECVFMALPLAIKGGSASPVRAVALVPRTA